MGFIGNQNVQVQVTNLNDFGGKVADAAALAAVTGMSNGTVYITEDNNHAWMYNGSAWDDIGELRGPAGAVGPTGATGIAGASVDTVVRTTGDGSAGTTDTYTITYSDATTSTFTVYNGADGVPGVVDHTARTAGTGAAGTTDTYTLYADVAETQVLGTFDVVNGTNGTGTVASITAGANTTVDLTDPTNPIIAADVSTGDLALKANKANPIFTGLLTEQVSVSTLTLGATSSVQTYTATADFTIINDLVSGEFVTFILDGAGFTPTYPTMIWWEGAEPTLGTKDKIFFENIGGLLYGSHVASIA